MSETPAPLPHPQDPATPAVVHGSPSTLTHATAGRGGGSPLVRFGGILGIAASVAGLLILVAACHGLQQAVSFSYVPIALAGVGLLLSLVGAVAQHHRIDEDTHVLLALFTNGIGIVGGLLEMAVWRGWNLFPGS